MHEMIRGESYKGVDVRSASPEAQEALARAIEEAFLNPIEDEITEHIDTTAARRTQRLNRSLHRVKTTGYFTRKPGSESTPSGVLATQSQVAAKTRGSIFRRFTQSEWSAPEYSMTYFYDYREYQQTGRNIVRFQYWPGSGHMSISGKSWLFGELGLVTGDPLDIFIKLLKPCHSK
ncbi:hypothetical protein HYW35_03200 [Candidatus Saccharibacteria bacterium]|nr:hypothetical protein [Candidatus Saccharibacteria bacterium]